jgi:5'(3')-deoxyribonucleotidase
MNRVFIDLDGVVVDFEGYMLAKGMTASDIKKHPGAYFDMEPMIGALDAVRELIARGYEVWIATKPPTGMHHAYGDKAAWVLKHLPELATRIVITHDKGFLGDSGDYLIDDRPHKANCEQFAGTLIAFTNGKTWADVLAELPVTPITAATVDV